VLIETVEEGAKKTLNIPATFLTENSIHSSLVAEVTQSWTGTARLALFLDCSPLGLVTLSQSFRDMMTKSKPPIVHAVRETIVVHSSFSEERRLDISNELNKVNLQRLDQIPLTLS
jgi:hypothetical protein